MKKLSTPIFLFAIILFSAPLLAQNAGIGTTTPDHKLHVSGNTSNLLRIGNSSGLNTGVTSDIYLSTGTWYTGALKSIGTSSNTARLGLFTFAAPNSSSLVERLSILDNGFVGIGVTNPTFMLDINGRTRVRTGAGGSAGIAFMDAANVNNKGFIGMKDDNHIGLYGYNGASWALTMNVNTGDVEMQGILTVGDAIYANGNGFYVGYFNNYSGQDSYPAIEAKATSAAGKGTAITASGGKSGIYALADMHGTGHRYGIEAYGRHGDGNNYGIYATAFSGNNAIGVYGSATGGNTNWGGYFSGNVYSSGTYQGSDRKLKNDIQPVHNAIELINALKPTTYVYKTQEYAQMELPQGRQYGLIADEVKQVFPDLVKQAVQPAKYENEDRVNGKLIADEVAFEAVNYTGMIPVLIAAMQEQQAMIDIQQKRIEALEKKLRDQH